MNTTVTPAFELDLSDRANCSSIVNAKPGQYSIVFVTRPNHPTRWPKGAIGQRSGDGKFFGVKVSTSGKPRVARTWRYGEPCRNRRWVSLSDFVPELFPHL